MPTKVKIVEYGEQAKVKIVSYGETMKVIPVEYGEQMKVKIVEYGEDFKVKIVRDTSVCFITTACTKAMGLSDNCLELNILRTFRDRYIKTLPNGDEIIYEYYEVAPQIVSKINKADNQQQVYVNLYERLVSTIKLIRQGKDDEAFRNYLRMFNELKQKYLES